MRFRLAFEGSLLGASQTKPRSEHKHEIRRVLDPQLRKIWEDNPLLKIRGAGIPIAPPKKVGNYRCLPLVTEVDKAFVSLDVLFLRPGPLGVILPNTGDLDNRISTLFDALQIPPDGTNLGKYTNPAPGEELLYCLVEDDKLISRVSVESDTLLSENYALGQARTRPANHALLILTVDITPTGSGLAFSRF